MTDPRSPVWFITGCSTGFGRALARLVLGRVCYEAATAKYRERRAEIEGLRETSLGADFPTP